MPTPPQSFNEAVKNLLIVLRSLLGTNGVNVLGTYRVDKGGTAPSIQIRNVSKVTYSIVPPLGVECVIYADPYYRMKHAKGGVFTNAKIQVVLDQHDPTKNLSLAIEAIYAHPNIRPFDQPQIKPRMEKTDEKGEIPARAILFVPFYDFQQSLF